MNNPPPGTKNVPDQEYPSPDCDSWIIGSLSVDVKSVLEMKGQLKNVTKEIVNKLPIQDTYIVKKGEKDNNNILSSPSKRLSDICGMRSPT